MSAQSQHISSILLSFSTFVEHASLAPADADAALLFLLDFLHSKQSLTSWSAAEVTEFADRLSQKQAPPSSKVIEIVTAYIEKFPPHQVNVFLHEFLLALTNDGCSSSTVINYRSDINQFIDWSDEHLLGRLLSKPKVVSFLENEREKGLKVSSIKRKLASISQFILWAEKKGLIDHATRWVTELNQNCEHLLSTHSSSSTHHKSRSPFPHTFVSKKDDKSAKTWSLPVPTPLSPAHVAQEREKHSALSRQDYRSRLRSSLSGLSERLSQETRQHFLPYLNLVMISLFFIGAAYLGWRQFGQDAAEPFAYPSALNRPNRTLSFQGRLTDTTQTPIIAPTNMQFKLYDFGPGTGGSELWDSGVCSITPDQDGIFSTGLGDDCGSEIGSDVFTENSNVWLEVTVASETLTPRQQIKTVAYALNSETLQGYPASASAVENTVLIMDNNGEIVLGNANPVLKATGNSFAIEAETMTLRTAAGSNGNIVLDPDGSGITQVLSDLVTTGYISAPGATLSATYAGGTALTLKAGPTATADIMRWQNSGGSTLGVLNNLGYLGVGTTAPSQLLDVGGDVVVTTGGNLGVGTTNPTQQFDVGGNVVVTSAGNLGVGTTNPAERLDVSGNLRVTGTTTFGGITYTWPGSQTPNQFLQTNGSGVLSWVDVNSVGFWNLLNGALFPKNPTVDLLVGGSATESAKFAFMNVNSGAPTASISGNLAVTAPTGANPATSIDVFNGGTLNFRSSVGGNAGLTSRLFISNTGNIGVGTTNPTAQFTVAGTGDQDVLLSSSTANATLTLNSNTNSDSRIILAENAINKWTITTDGNNSDRLIISGDGGLGGDDFLTIEQTGNIGIGTTNALAQLHLSDNYGIMRFGDNNSAASTSQAGLEFYSDFSATRLGQVGFFGDGNLLIANEITGRNIFLMPTTNNNVGIGTTTPGYKLDVAGTGYFSGALSLGTQATTTAHAVRADRSIATGNGLTGGGNLTADRTLSVNAPTCSGTDKLQWNGTAFVCATDQDTNTFLGLTDTPSSYSGNSLYLVRVNAGTTALEFVDPSTVGTNYWQRIAGVLSPANGEAVAATGSATTVATFTSTGTNAALRAGGTASYSTIDSTGNLLIQNGGAIDTRATGTLTLGGSTQSGLTVGRTGANTVINGDTTTIYGNSAVRISNLTTNGVVYTSGGTGTLNSEAQLAIARGGTNSTATPTAGAVAYGTGTAYAFNSAGTAGMALISGGTTAPTFGTLGLVYGGTNADLSGVAEGGLIYKGASALAGTGALTGVLKGNGSSAPTAMTGTTNYVTKWTNASTIGNSIIFDNGTNVGIGTTTPATIFNIGGASNKSISVDSGLNRAFYGAYQDAAVLGVNRDPAVGTFMHAGKASSYIAVVGAVGSGYIDFSATNTNGSNPPTVMRITGTGNVGIGTTNPSANLEISNSSDASLVLAADTGNTIEDANPRLELRQDGGLVVGGLGYIGNAGEIYANSIQNAMYLLNDYASAIHFGTGGVIQATLSDAGNFGIGTTAPTNTLDVNGSLRIRTITGTSSNTLCYDANGVVTGCAAGSVISGSGTTNYTARWTGTSSLGTGALVDNGTNVGIGIGSTNPTARLQVSGAIVATSGDITTTKTSGTAQMYIDNSGTTATDDSRLFIDVGSDTAGDPYTVYRIAGSWQWSVGADNSDGNKFKISGGGGGLPGIGDMFTINTSGNVGIGTNSPTSALSVGSGNYFRVGSDGIMFQDVSNASYDIWLQGGSSTAGGDSRNLALLGTSSDDLILNYNTEYDCVSIGGTSCTNALDVSGVSNATTGFRVNNDAPSGQFLRGNGTNFVASAIQLSDLPAITSAGGWTDDGSTIRLTTIGDNVGIGTTTATAKLTISGDLHVAGNGIITRTGPQNTYYPLDGTTINPSEWVNTAGVSQNDQFVFTGAASGWNDGITSTATFSRSQDLTFEADVRMTSNGYLMLGFKNNDTSSFSYTQGHHYLYFGGTNSLIYENGSLVNNPSTNFALNTQYRVRITLKAGGGAAYYVSTNQGASWTTLWAGDTDPTNSPLRIGIAYNSGTFYVDNIEVYSPSNRLWANSGRIMSTADGNVGIGTTSPQAKLDVAGGFVFGTSRLLEYNDDNNGITKQGATGGWAFGLVGAKGSSGADLGGFGAYGSSDALNRFYIGEYSSNELVSILAGGNVGIGTVSPSERLAVAGNATANRLFAGTAASQIAASGNTPVNGGLYLQQTTSHPLVSTFSDAWSHIGATAYNAYPLSPKPVASSYIATGNMKYLGGHYDGDTQAGLSGFAGNGGNFFWYSSAGGLNDGDDIAWTKLGDLGSTGLTIAGGIRSGSSTATAYNHFGAGGSPTYASDNASDLFIEDELEVGGNAYVTGSANIAGNLTVSGSISGAYGGSWPLDNLVNNGSFEFDADSNGIPDYWTSVGTGCQMSLNSTAGNQTEGQKSLALYHIDSGSTSCSPYLDMIPVKPNTTYNVSLMTKKAGSATAGFYFRVYQFQQDQSTAGTPLYHTFAENQSITTTWTRKGGTITTGPDTYWVRLRVWNNSSISAPDTFYIDDLRMTQAEYGDVVIANTNVGIGTTAPGATLDVNGTAKVYSAIGAADNVRTGLAHYDTTAQAAGVGGQLVLGYKYTDAGAYTEGAIIKMYKENATSGQYGSGINFQVRNNGANLSTKMTLNPSGSLGIGTTAPGASLDVVGTTKITPTTGNPALFLGRVTGRPNIKAISDGYLIMDSDTQFAAINYYVNKNVILAYGGGNVGIGTNTPEAKLDIAGTTLPALEVAGTQLMRYKYGPNTFNVSDAPIVLEYTDSGSSGMGTASFMIYFKARDDSNDYLDEVWYFGAQGQYLNAGYTYTMHRVSGTKKVRAYEVTNSGSNLEIEWHLTDDGVGFNDSVEITVMEVLAGHGETHRGNFTAIPWASRSGGTEITNGGNGHATFGGSGSHWLMGDVGIGTTAPEAKLDVSGYLGFTPSSYSSFVKTGGEGIVLNNGNDLEWLGSSSSSGYGHRLYSIDPGSLTHLRLAARNNSGSWTDMVTFTTTGRVGIGTTAPGYMLQANGDIYANGGWMRVSANRGIYFQTHGGGWHMTDSTWIKNYGSKALNIAGNGTNAAVFTGGNVGIGTSAPSYLLDVAGNGRVNGNLYVGSSGNYLSSRPSGAAGYGEYGSIQINDSGDNGWEGYSIDGRYVLMSDDDNTVGIYNDVVNQWVFLYERNNYVRLYEPDSTNVALNIAASGNLGIGTTNPTYKLDVNGTTRLNGNTIINNTTATGLTINTSGSGSNRQLVLANTSTGAAVDIQYDVGGITRWALSARGSGDYNEFAFWKNNTSNVWSKAAYFNYATNDFISNENVGIGDGAPRARLGVGGGLGIGTGNAISTLEGNRRSIQLATDTSYGGTYNEHSGFLIYSTLPSAGWGYATLNFSRSLNWGTYASTPSLTIASTNVGIGTTSPEYALHVVGNAGKTSGGGTWITISDSRLKQNIIDFTDGLDVLTKIRPISYEFNGLGGTTRGDKSIGIIAQEMLDVAPYTIGTFTAEDPLGQPTEYYNYDANAVTYILINAVKEQQVQIASTSARVTRLSALQESLTFDSEGSLQVASASANYAVTPTAGGSPLTTIAGFAELITGKLRAGLIQTQDLVVTQTAQLQDVSVASLRVGGQTLREYIAQVVSELPNNPGTQAPNSQSTLLSPVADITELTLETATISGSLSAGTLFAEESTTSSLTTTELTATGSTRLSQLLTETATISGTLTAEAVTTETVSANTVETASLSATTGRIAQLEAGMAELEQVKAQVAELSSLTTTSLEAQDATISGTLYANSIDRLDEHVAAALRQPTLLELLLHQQTEGAAAAPGVDQVIAQVESSGFTATDSASTRLTLADLQLGTDDIVLESAALFIDQYFEVNGLAYFGDTLGVRNRVTIGDGMLLSSGMIAYEPPLSDPTQTVFQIQPSGRGTLSLMAGLLTLTEDGQVTISGSLAVAGDIKTEGTLLSNLLKPVDYGSPFQVQVAGASEETGAITESRFEIINATETPVATISAQGKASFTGLSVSADDLRVTTASTSAEPVTSEKSAGKATIPAGSTEITIKATTLTESSLIYVTPLSSTQNQTLYVKSQQADNPSTPEVNEAQFTVGFDTSLSQAVEFNWWLVN